MSDMWRLMMGLFGLVAATIAIPQIIIAFRNKDQKELVAATIAMLTAGAEDAKSNRPT